VWAHPQFQARASLDLKTNVKRILLSWSGGKDSALALSRLRADPDVTVVGLLTTVAAESDRVSVHGVPKNLLQQQAAALQLPLHEIVIPAISSNEDYRAAWKLSLANLPVELRSASHIACGDICLEDVRSYREALLNELGYETMFPLWGESTNDIAREVLHTGFAATLVCIDTHTLPASFAGRSFDASLLHDLPPHVDPCGEHGEFHTFVSDGPGFDQPVQFRIGCTVLENQRFAFCNLEPVVPV